MKMLRAVEMHMNHQKSQNSLVINGWIWVNCEIRDRHIPLSNSIKKSTLLEGITGFFLIERKLNIFN